MFPCVVADLELRVFVVDADAIFLPSSLGLKGVNLFGFVH